MARINREEYQILKSLNNKWKWIARDEHESLFAYSEKPPKDNYTRDWGFAGDEWLLIEKKLFQFIQWKDKEPHNIVELIQEYEIENGMRYDFGKIKVVDIDTSKLATRNGYIYVKESEELEVKSIQDLIDKWENYKNGARTVADSKAVEYSDKFINDLNQLDELESPVIPKFVANWIEASRDATYHLLGAVYDGAYNEDMKEWLFKGDKRTRQDNQDKLTRAWLLGYTIEEEQKYYARIKGHALVSDSEDGYWNVDGKELYIDNNWHDYSGYKITKLTKDEWENLGINKDNADFVLVEELEE